jgi:hypothetical protein
LSNATIALITTPCRLVFVVSRLLGILGSVLAVLGNVGWAIIIGDLGTAWPFWAMALGTLVAAFQPLESYRGPWGWLLPSAGALWLLVDQLGHGLGPDFPAEYLYYLGLLLAGAAAVTHLLRGPSSRVSLLLAAGLALTAVGGLWWVGLDIAKSFFDYTWENASLGAGYLLLALSVYGSSRAEERSMRAEAGTA